MVAHKWHHEQIFRGQAAMDRLAKVRLAICGAGALGSNLAVSLVRQGLTGLTIIDRDRVEPHNVGTQVYSLDDSGGLKAEILRNLIYREVGEDVIAIPRELDSRNVAKLLKGHDLIVDSFDNSASRAAVADFASATGVACLHLGVNDQYGEIRWNENYIVPSDVGEDVCDYPLARNLILLVTSLAGEVIVRFILEGKRQNLSLTLGDLSINKDSDLL